MLAGGAWIAVRGLSARSDLEAAKGDLAAAQRALLDQKTDEAKTAIDAAGQHTAHARRATGDPVWRLAGHLPLVGRSVSTVRALSALADELASGALPGAGTLSSDLDPKRLRRTDGGIDLTAVRDAQPTLKRLAQTTAALRARANALPTAGLLGPVARARGDVSRRFNDLGDAVDAADRTISLLPALLGGDRPRRYFVMVQQTSESRGTGGLTGGFAIIEARNGRLNVTSQGTDADLRNGRVPVPAGVPADYVKLYNPNGAFDLWQNVNLSPNLPVVARVVAARWKQQSGQSVDGVVALDAVALTDILRGSGPIDVGNRQRVQAAALPDFLAVGQYAGIPVVSSQQRIRKDRLTAVARAATKRLTTGGGSSSALARGLSDAVRTGHLRMASDDAALRGLAQAHVDGAFPDGPAPFAYAVINNSTGGKLDYFLDRSVRYEAGACRSQRRGSEITVDLTNRPPARGLPPYLTIKIDSSGVHASTDSAVLLAVYATRGSRLLLASLNGQPLALGHVQSGASLSSGSDDGVPVWYAYLDLPRDKTQRLVLDLDEPAAPGRAQVPEQPLARELSASTAVGACR